MNRAFKRCRYERHDYQIAAVDSTLKLSEAELLLLRSRTGISADPTYPELFSDPLTAQPENVFACVRERGELIAIFHFQVVRFSGMQLQSFIPESLHDTIRSMLIGILRRFKTRILVSGNIFQTGDAGIYSFETGNTPGAALVATVRHLLNTDRSLGAYLCSDLYDNDAELDAALTGAGFVRTGSEPDMEFEVRPGWAHFSDYLAALSTKYRTRAKRTLVKNEHFQREALSIDDIRSLSQELHLLYLQIIDGVKLKLAAIDRNYFLRQKQATPEQYSIFGYFHGGRLSAFVSYFRSGERLEVHYIGRDKATTTDTMLYERMLLDSVALGIDHGVKTIHFGRTATEVKSTIGAEAKPMHGYVYHNRHLRNKMFAFVSGVLQPSQTIMRNPFKMSNVEQMV